MTTLSLLKFVANKVGLPWVLKEAFVYEQLSFKQLLLEDKFTAIHLTSRKFVGIDALMPSRKGPSTIYQFTDPRDTL